MVKHMGNSCKNAVIVQDSYGNFKIVREVIDTFPRNIQVKTASGGMGGVTDIEL
jgi:hypothetical protein